MIQYPEGSFFCVSTNSHSGSENLAQQLYPRTRNTEWSFSSSADYSSVSAFVAIGPRAGLGDIERWLYNICKTRNNE